jgi:hypothetical protein
LLAEAEVLSAQIVDPTDLSPELIHLLCHRVEAGL